LDGAFSGVPDSTGVPAVGRRRLRLPIHEGEAMEGEAMEDEEIRDLLAQALKTELGGVQVYTTALRCAVNEDLKRECEEYLEQTQNHVRIVEEVFSRLEWARPT
jgi:rubrerythrin